MTLGSDHYVPVLKVKRGEKKALQSIEPSLQQRITPLLEIVERKPDSASTVSAHLDKTFRDLADSLRLYPRCFLDARELVADGPSAALEVFHRAASAGIVFTPVTGVSRSADVAAAIKYKIHGMALRLTRKEFEDGRLARILQDFMTKYGLAPQEIDLIVDLGPVDDMVGAGVAALSGAFLADVPDHQKWRTFIISACAFPPSMGRVTRNSHDLVERTEWTGWRDNLHANRHTLLRLPTFSDCAIQHTKGVEGFDPLKMQVSASVRYSSMDNWLLIKGESTRIKSASTQFPMLAKQLVYDHLQSHFRGANHCSGCMSIQGSADGASHMGSAEVWRRIGTVHHITAVVQEIAALPWP